MDKEYSIKIVVEFTGVIVGENRQEALEDTEILDFIDEAAHSGSFKIVDTDTRLRMRSVLAHPKEVLRALNPGREAN
jgi:hypothetical protein